MNRWWERERGRDRERKEGEALSGEGHGRSPLAGCGREYAATELLVPFSWPRAHWEKTPLCV